MSAQLPWVDVTRLSMAAAIEAIERALLDGLDPEADAPRGRAAAGDAGHFLLMPSAWGGYAGVKVSTVAPANPDRGLPRIQGLYVLFDAATLTPRAVMDGAAITALRTPAVSAVAAKHLARGDVHRLLLFGTGPQAYRHLEALRIVLPALDTVKVVARDVKRTARFAAEHDATVVDDVGSAVRDADLICCCTTARDPLFDGALVTDDAMVIAVGSHEPAAAELDAELMRRATVVVESTATALGEAGDVMQAIDAGALTAEELVRLDEVVRGERLAPASPRVFKSAGMSWEDVVVAGAAWDRERMR